MVTTEPGILTEQLYRGYWQSLQISGKSLVVEQSAFQRIEIVDTPQNGRVLALDNIIQITSRDESAYSEMLSHVPILEHGGARNVLIVGGGDCCIAEEVLKHDGVGSCDLAEIDPRVIELCREYFAASNAKAFADPRFHIHVTDAAAFLKSRTVEGRYDVIIGDRPDPVGPAGVLFEQEFYQSVAKALAPGGVAVFQAGVPFYQPEELLNDQRDLSRAFRHTGLLLTVVPTYVGGYMALSWGSNSLNLGSPESLARARALFERKPFPTDYYTPDIHAAAFAHPMWLKRLLANR